MLFLTALIRQDDALQNGTLNISSSPNFQLRQHCPTSVQEVSLSPLSPFFLTLMFILVRSVLCDASRILESLAETSGVQSFLLAVDPHDPADAGFLGGSVSGREFWRGLRGGGESGAKSFKLYCQSHNIFNPGDTQDQYPPPLPQASTSKAPPARSLKAELYDHVRKALR